MASRGKKKNPLERADKRDTLVVELKERWNSKVKKFAVVTVVLLALALIFSLPFTWNGFVALSVDGEMSVSAEGPLYDIITDGEGGETQTTELKFDLPVNPWMVTFAPAYCNSGVNFFLIEALTGLGYEFDRDAAGYSENVMGLDAATLELADKASVAALVICVLTMTALIAMIVVCAVAVSGKTSAKAAFIASLVFTALTVVQFVFGIVLCSTRIPSQEGGTVRFVPGAFMFLAPVFGAALSAVTGVWSRRGDRDRKDYLELKAELEKNEVR